MRVAIYARVSTDDKGQDPENQLRELREWCQRSGHEVVREFVEHVSGRKGEVDRPQFAAMMDDAAKRKFDVLLVWALDRLTREGMAATVLYLRRLTTYGVAFHSYTEPLISTDNELVRDIVVAIMSSLARVEARKVSERTRAGLARARAKGKHLGRPELDRATREKIAQRLAEGATAYRVAKELGIDRKTVQKYGTPTAAE
jgi:DNA invertase Pin-like site-specific DNA recombinase